VDDRSDAEAVLITGPYGSGKTSVIEELAAVLEDRGTPYAAIDLDWLGWFDPGFGDHDAGRPVMLKNLGVVVGNYYEAGPRRFVLAGAISTASHASELRTALAMPLTIVRLTLPIEAIERRLAGAVTAGRADDLRVAREWIADARDEGIGDLVLSSDRPIRDVADDVLAALAW